MPREATCRIIGTAVVSDHPMSAAEIAHLPEPVPSLDERRDRIMAVLESTALEIGDELLAAKREHPREFMAWVTRALPFGIDKAERLMAITRSFATVDPLVRASLPPAWTALYELSRLPIETVVVAIDRGEISPQMTVEDARELVTGHREAPKAEKRTSKPGPDPGFDPNPRLTTDIVARELLRTPREDLSATMETLLRLWLDPKET